MDSDKRFLRRGNKGDVLVFLHYFGGSAKSWQWVAKELSNQYQCIAINLPGFGGAAAMDKPSIQGFAEYVQEVLDSLKIKKYTLIGHSMGGKIAMQVAANASKGSVQQLILVAPSPPTTEPMKQEEKERMLKHPDRQVAEKTVNGAVKQTLQAQRHKLAVETQLIIDEATWRWWLLEGMEHSIAEKVKSLELPVKVLASKDDPVMTFDVIEQRVMQVLVKAKLVTTQQIGHLSPLEAAEWVASEIGNLVEKEKAK